MPEATIKNMVSNLFRMDGVLESHPDETLYHLIIESRQLGAYGCKTVNGPSFEPFRWLVEKQDVHLPPVFTKMDGSYFNIHELKGDLGFQVQCVYSSRLCINARHFENHIHTGHRKIGSGANKDASEASDSYLAEIFITYYPISKQPWRSSAGQDLIEIKGTECLVNHR